MVGDVGTLLKIEQQTELEILAEMGRGKVYEFYTSAVAHDSHGASVLSKLSAMTVDGYCSMESYEPFNAEPGEKKLCYSIAPKGRERLRRHNDNTKGNQPWAGNW